MLFEPDVDLKHSSFSPQPNSVLEAWSMKNGKPKCLHTTDLDEPELGEWLLERAPRTGRPLGAVAGVRMIVCSPHDSQKPLAVPFTEPFYRRLADGLDYPAQFAEICLQQSRAYFASINIGGESGKGKRLGFIAKVTAGSSAWSLALSYSPANGVTTPTVFGLSEFEYAQVLPDRLRLSAHLVAHPMLVPLLLADMTFRKLQEEVLEDLTSKLAALEQKTGSIFCTDTERVTPDATGLLTLTKDVGKAQQLAQEASGSIRLLQSFLDEISAIASKIELLLNEQQASFADAKSIFSQFQDASQEIDEHITYLQRNIRHTQILLSEFDARLNSQLRTVHVLAALQAASMRQPIADKLDKYTEQMEGLAEALSKVFKDSARSKAEMSRITNDLSKITATAEHSTSTTCTIILLMKLCLPAVFISALISLLGLIRSMEPSKWIYATAGHFRACWATIVTLTGLVIWGCGCWIFGFELKQYFVKVREYAYDRPWDVSLPAWLAVS